MNRLILFLALTACAWSQPTMPFAFWKSAAASWTPASIGDSLYLWVEADNIPGKAVGDTLYMWPDLSGKGNHLYQLTGGLKPVLQDTSGKRMVTLDGVDDYMQCTTLVKLVQPSTIYWVGRASGGGLYLTRYDGAGSAAERHDLASNLAADKKFNLFAGTIYTSTTVDADSLAMIGAVFNGASSSVRVNARTTSSGNAGTQPLVGFIIGAARGLTTIGGKQMVRAILVIHGTLSDATRDALEEYLKNKWGTP